MRWLRRSDDDKLLEALQARRAAAASCQEADEIKKRIDRRLEQRARRAERTRQVIAQNGFGTMFERAFSEGKRK